MSNGCVTVGAVLIAIVIKEIPLRIGVDFV